MNEYTILIYFIYLTTIKIVLQISKKYSKYYFSTSSFYNILLQPKIQCEIDCN